MMYEQRKLKAYLNLVEQVAKIDHAAAMYMRQLLTETEDHKHYLMFELSGGLHTVFVWNFTPQGYCYWKRICAEIVMLK